MNNNKNDLFNIQIPLDKSQKGKNIQIDLSDSVFSITDFGFEGYEPNNMMVDISYRAKHVFTENLYDRLEAELVEGENLYFYTHNRVSVSNIKYTENLRHKNNKYNFAVIPANSPYKTFIINNGKKYEIMYQINYCNSPHNVQMYYQSSEYDDEKLISFNNGTTSIRITVPYYSVKLRFESESNFVFSYSHIDLADRIFNYEDPYLKIRKVETDLTIHVNKRNHDDSFSNDFIISFKPNYYNSSTKYIIVIISSTDEKYFGKYGKSMLHYKNSY